VRALFVSFALAATLAGGCDNFKPASFVEGVRILGIHADPPEVASGEQAMLVPLVVDPGVDLDAGVPDITYEWALCNKRPAIGIDVDPDCFDADGGDLLTPLPTLAGGATMVTMPPRTLADFNLPDTTGGFYVPVRLRISAGDTHITAFERLRWKAGFVPPNQNPGAMGIAYVPTGTDGQLPDLGQTVDPQPLDENTPMDLPLGGKLRLRGSDTPGSSESYMTFVGDLTNPSNVTITTVTETVQFFWYASAGKLDPDVTGEARPDAILDTTQYTDTLAARAGLVDLWLVVRDERGGVDFLHRQIHLH
jgi:hypothetical protein